MKKIIIFLLACSFSFGLKAQLTVDLTTGKDNFSGLQIPAASQEDSWELLTGSGYVFPYVSNGIWMNFSNPIQLWAAPASCGMWIGSTVSSTTGYLNGNPQHSWNEEYKLDFYNNAGCNLTNARIEISTIGVDNSLYFELNGNTSAQYQVNTAIGDCSIATNNYAVLNTSTITIPINPAYLLPGLNQIRVFLCNNDRHSGFYLCAELKADYLPDPNLVPTITSATNFCSGSPIVVNGTSATTNVNWHYWEMAECYSNGTLVPSGYLWSNFYGGAPTGSFSIPNSATAPCGRYYKIKLALSNACSAWSEISKVIYLECSPAPVITGPSVLCYGQSGTYSVNFPRGYTYLWSTGSTIKNLTFTPTSSMVLSVTVTSPTGCSGVATFQITVNNTNSDFIPTTTLYPGYYTCTATPVVTTGLPPGFGYAWIIEEVSGPPTYTSIPNTLVNNPAIGCWWTMTCNFTGYNGTSTYPSTCPAGNPPGQLLAGHYYRITRGTWSTGCGWQQTSKVVFMCNLCHGSSPIVVEEDPNAPSYEGLASTLSNQYGMTNNFSIVPNPNNGNFQITMNHSVVDATVELYNLMGEKVSSQYISNSNSILINSGNLAKGVYIVKINTDAEVLSQRMIIE